MAENVDFDEYSVRFFKIIFCATCWFILRQLTVPYDSWLQVRSSKFGNLELAPGADMNLESASIFGNKIVL